jgi:hypothetical protein
MFLQLLSIGNISITLVISVVMCNDCSIGDIVEFDMLSWTDLFFQNQNVGFRMYAQIRRGKRQAGNAYQHTCQSLQIHALQLENAISTLLPMASWSVSYQRQ